MKRSKKKSRKEEERNFCGGLECILMWGLAGVPLFVEIAKLSKVEEPMLVLIMPSRGGSVPWRSERLNCSCQLVYCPVWGTGKGEGGEDCKRNRAV